MLDSPILLSPILYVGGSKNIPSHLINVMENSKLAFAICLILGGRNSSWKMYSDNEIME